MDDMRISELAARSGVPASTLRYYEAEGLLPARRADNGYRVYGATALDRLAFIAQAKHLDLPLQSVHELVDTPLAEVDGGIRATIPIAEIESVAALAAAEQECCGFYAIRIDIHGPTFDLTITAPDEAASMLRDLVPSTQSSTR